MVSKGCNEGGKLSCLNNGTCLANGYCECEEGYSGHTCSRYTEMPSKIGCRVNSTISCKNNGICQFNGICDCKFGYSGDTCSNCMNKNKYKKKTY